MSRWLAGPLILVAAVGALGASGIRFNLTASMPAGLYRTVPDALPVRGAIVLACLPPHAAEIGRTRGYLPGGDCPDGVMPVGKPIAAVAGDTVDVDVTGIRVNGWALANSRVLARDAVGRPMAGVPPGRYLVAAGALWLVSGYSARSYDSRYFGAVAAARVRAVVRPLWTITR